ncbi:hypothetical protein ACMFMG_003880 [Clarireedia jacksonii]
MIVSRIICGEKYARDKEWIKTVAEFARGVFFHGLIFRKLLMWCRDVTSLVRTSMTSEKGQHEQEQEEGIILPALVTEVETREFYKDKTELELIQGINYRMMHLLFAMVDTTVLTFNHVIYDIIGHKKDIYTKKLREEIREMGKKYRGIWMREVLGELRLLDSFLKESQRMHPLGYTLGNRKVVRKEGVSFRIGAARGEKGAVDEGEEEKEIFIKRGERMDPDNWDKLKVFKGFRYADNAVPITMPSEKFISFGFGIS